MKLIKNAWAVLTEGERKRFLRLVLFDVLISVADVFFLFVLLLLVQHYIQPYTGHYHLPSWFANSRSLWPVAVFFLLFCAKNTAGYLVSKAHFSLNGDVAIRISENNLQQFQQGRYENYVRIDSSEYIRKIAFQPFEFSQQVLSGIQQIITQLFLIAITLAGILLLNAQLFLLLLLILLPPVTVVFYVIKRRQIRAGEQIRTSNEISYRYLFDALKGFVEGNVYLRNGFFRRRFVEARRTFCKHLFATLSLQTLPSRMVELFAVFGLIALLALVRWTGSDDSSSLLLIGAFMAAAYKMIPGLVKIINLAGQLKAYAFTPGDFEKQLEEEKEKNSTKSIHTLQLKNAGFQFNGVPAFHNVSLHLQRGDFVGIFGTSGLGKTTLFNVLLGFLPLQNGEIFVNEEKALDQNLKMFWPSIAYVRQQCFLLHDTVLKNITLSEESCNQQRLLQALHLSGLEDMLQHSADGLQKLITENGKNISGGQQQRIAIARALYKDADVFFLDEPFNELDEASETKLLQHFRCLADCGKIVVMVTHNRQAASFCTKILDLDEN